MNSGFSTMRPTGVATCEPSFSLRSSGTISQQPAEPSSGSHVVAVSYARRTSDSLRALGFRDGIAPHVATKVVFTTTDDRIRAFANGGSEELCRPS